jgi:hypothetical protein
MTQITTRRRHQLQRGVLALNRRFTSGLQIQTSYTYSRPPTAANRHRRYVCQQRLNPFDLGLEEGVSNFDIPHRFSFNTVWMPRSSNVWLDNFMFAPVIGISSGAPFHRWCQATPPDHSRANRRARRWRHEPPAQTERNSYRLPSSASVDLRVSRAFPIGKSKLEASFEAFNLFNKINYTSATTTFYTIAGSVAAPTLVYNAATFNTYTNANSGTFSPRPREIQLGVRYTF